MLASSLAAVHRHPRHALLFAATAGLLLGPLSAPGALVAALAAAVLTAVAARAAPTAADTPGPPTASATPSGDPPRPPGLAAPASPSGDPPRPPAPSAPATPSGVPPRPRAPAAHLAFSLVAAGAVLAGALVADLRIASLEGGVLPAMHGRPLESRAVLLEPVRERGSGPAVARGGLLDGAVAGEVAVLRVRAEAHPGAWPEVGEIVAVAGTVAPLGRYDAYQRRRGAGAALEVSRLRRTGERRGGVPGVVDAARRRAEAGLSRELPPARAALLRGMVLGQDEALSDTTRDEFERSGLAHILAVSGQNVMLLATLVLAVGAVAGAGLRSRLVLALALVAFYVPLTGAGPSIQRAGVMGAAGLVAALAGRPAHRWYALGLAAALTLALNPRAAGEPGWQLSFAAVVALLAMAPGLRGALARHLPGPVADVAAITVSATLGTAPLMAMHFGQVSLVALPANLLAAAAIAPIMWLGMLAAAAAQVAPGLAAPFNAANAPLLEFVEWTAATMAAAPGAVLPAQVGSPAALAVVYAALAAALLAIRAAWRRAPGVRGHGPAGRPAAAGAPGPRGALDAWDPRDPFDRRRRRLSLAALAAVAVLLVTASRTGDGARPPLPGELVVSFLDVGQGDATLLQHDGVDVLVDTGPADGPILERLAAAGVGRLDALVITHAQADHEGAALAVMRAHPPRLVVNGGAGWPTGVQRALAAAVGEARARTVDGHAGDLLRLGGLRFRVLWPPQPRAGFRPDGDPNDRALVAHVESGDFDLLLPADAESNVTAAIDLPRVEALKVAHHGSADEGLPAMLERTRPEVAAIEVGRGNSYGHPAPSTLAALRRVPQVLRTDRDGTVRLRVRDGAMRVERG